MHLSLIQRAVIVALGGFVAWGTCNNRPSSEDPDGFRHFDGESQFDPARPAFKSTAN